MDSDSEVEFEEKEWTEVEDNLCRLSLLQTEACERLSVLTSVLASLETSKQSKQSEFILSMIQKCHEESMTTLEKTGEVTFGQRLIALTSNTVQMDI